MPATASIEGPIRFVQEEARYELDGEPVALDAFLGDNPDLDAGDVYDVRHLEIGEEFLFGGGAGAEFVLRRVA